MTEKPTFDPTRSAAIRQLLIENVNAEPRRRTRHLRALLAGLIVTGIVASGTTALALNRESLFGADQPVATSTPTESVAPTPAPTPTVAPPTPKPSPVTVSEAPVAPRDVDTLPAQASWSMELPGVGDGCRGVRQFTVSDGFALFQVGPILHDEFESPCDESQNTVTLTLVNTDTGAIVWSRSWEAAIQTPTKWGAEALVLGTSGRVLMNEVATGSGTAEVLDIATGATLSSVAARPDAERMAEAYSIPGDSGEVYAVFIDVDSAGNHLDSGTIRRFDPLDALDPVWSTPVGGYVALEQVTNTLAYTSVSSFGATGSPYAVLDLTTGALSPRADYLDYDFFTGYTIRASGPDDQSTEPRTLTGLDDQGNQLWTRSESSDTMLSEVLLPDVRAGFYGYSGTYTGTGQFVTISKTAVSLVDGLTGETLWTSSQRAECGFEDASVYSDPFVRLSPTGADIFVTAPDQTTCRFDLQTGEPGAGLPGAFDYGTAFGQRLTYRLVEGMATAYDGESGEAVWSFSTTGSRIFFAGGRLVTMDGYTLTSVG